MLPILSEHVRKIEGAGVIPIETVVQNYVVEKGNTKIKRILPMIVARKFHPNSPSIGDA